MERPSPTAAAPATPPRAASQGAPGKTVPVKALALRCSAEITAREASLIRRVAELRRHRWLRALFLGASRGGDGPVWLAAGAVLLAFGSGRTRVAVLQAGLAVGASVLLFLSLKQLTSRPRPCDALLDLPSLLAAPDRFSFPSGHSITAFAIWSTFAQTVPGSTPVFLPLAVVVGFSRVFVGLHYPTDVLAGAVLGSGLGTVVVYLT